jgi:uncharacterized phage protein (TIGR02220 family)
LILLIDGIVLKVKVDEWWGYWLAKTQRDFKLTIERKNIIIKRLKEGRTLEELKTAVDNFLRDEWPDRHKYTDVCYCIGVRNHIDNLDKWLHVKEDKGEGVWTR